MKIFLAEDNEDNFLVVKSNVRKIKEDIELVWAKDGQEAMEMLESESGIKVFLVDIEMPKIGGVELAKWIRSQERFNETPIVAITASVFSEMKKNYLEEGFDYILEKPFARKDFLAMLSKAAGIE